MTLSRRTFLKNSGRFSIGFLGIRHLLGGEEAAAAALHSMGSGVPVAAGFGPLVTDPEGILDLPAGFRYTVLSTVGEEMTDGFIVPGRHDGMAAFEGPDGKTILIRNHELTQGARPSAGPFGEDNELLERLDPSLVYDQSERRVAALGCTTTLLFDTRTQTLDGHYLSLAGTLRNCAGGPTPWGSWLTCEESDLRADGRFVRHHGYMFEVPARITDLPVEPRPVLAAGRFYREAVAVMPGTSIVYQTEDLADGLLYRYVPDDPNDIHAGGVVEALAVVNRPRLDTRNWESTPEVPVGEELAVHWIPLDDVDAPDNDLRVRGFAAGAARFARGEGMWWDEADGQLFFACTSGGEERTGQIWQYTPSPSEGEAGESETPGTLTLFIEPNDSDLLENADNLTVAPWGDLIICEDGGGQDGLVGVTPAGELYRFAMTRVSNSEMAGATFSPDGTTLFVNIQSEGYTLAIVGPWENRS